MARTNWYNRLFATGLIVGGVAGYLYEPKIIEYIQDNIKECSKIVKFASESNGLCKFIFSGAGAIMTGTLTLKRYYTRLNILSPNQI